MKKRVLALLMSTVTAVALLAGCGGSGKTADDYVKLSGYKGITIDKLEKEVVTDDEVDAYIDSIIGQFSDKAVENGDMVNIDYVGTMDGEEFDGGSSQGVSLEIGSNTFIPGFEDSVLGHHSGDQFEFNGKFPDDYGVEALAGKDVTFAITLNYIEELDDAVKPKLTDELAVKMSTTGAKTVDEYREEVRAELQVTRDADYQDMLEGTVWNAVLDKVQVKELPQDRVDANVEMITKQYQEYADSMGVTLEDMLEEYYQMTLEDFNKEVKAGAEDNILQEVVSQMIAEKEGLVPSEDEYQQAIEEMAEEYGYRNVESLKEVADEETLKNMILQDIVVKWLTQYAVQK